MSISGLDPAHSPLETGAIVDRRFRIEQVLDVGPLASVYRATDQQARRTVALKVLTARQAARRDSSRRMQHDLKALQKLVHPNVARLYLTGTTPDGWPFIAMEYLEGDTLRRYLRKHRILSTEQMLPFALQIAEGLCAAHECGVLHGDLKPENVFVMRSGLVKIADFGTARLIAETHGERGFGIGTPAYMAPERLIDNLSISEDPRSDLYSLGTIEYEMLAGYNPVLGQHKDLSRAEVSWRQAAAPPRVPVGIPLELWSVLEPTLRKEPDRRPATAREHAEQLGKLAERLGGRASARPLGLAFSRALTPTELVVRRALRSLLLGTALGAAAGALVFAGWWFGAHQSGTLSRARPEAQELRIDPAKQPSDRAAAKLSEGAAGE